MSKNTIVYVDLGGSHISAIAGEVLDDNSLHILGEQVRPGDDVKSGMVEKITGAAFKVNETTKLLQNSLKWRDRISKVSICINAKSMKHHSVSVEKRIHNIVTERQLQDMTDACRDEIKTDNIVVFEIIPLAYYIDGKRVENPVGLKGFEIRADYNLIIGHYLVQESLERTIERTGIAVDYIHLGMEAIATALLDESDKDEGCAIINFGATTTTLGIYSEGKLQELLVVPLGGMNITRDILELGVSYRNAETLKCKTGCAMEKFVKEPVNIQIPSVHAGEAPVKISTAFLAVIIESRLDEMLTPIFKHIDTIPYPLHAGIIMSGGASKLKNLSEFIEENTGFQVRMGNHSEWLSDDTDSKFHNSEYAEAVGAILLSNDLYEQNKEEKTKKVAIDVKIPGKKFLRNVSKSFTNGMESLFKYDDMERRQYDVDKTHVKQDIENHKS
ncbi:MAG: cell division protein FtsA [Paludibacteraceae bacterium]